MTELDLVLATQYKLLLVLWLSLMVLNLVALAAVCLALRAMVRGREGS